MTETIAQWFTENLSFLSPQLIIFVVSIFPILELRGGIIAAALLGVDVWQAVLISFFGNLLPIPFVLLFIIKIMKWLKRFKIFRPFILWLESKAEKNRSKIDKYGVWGLILFVGIPLPGTGAWTGSLIAAVMQLDFKKAFTAITLGVVLACIIMTFLCYFIPDLIFK